jgi:hypothetical protein
MQKSKRKFRNADEARKFRELAEEWEKNQTKWKSMSKPVSNVFTVDKPPLIFKVPPGRETKHIPSIDMWAKGAVTVKQTQKYTGDRLLGVTILHKSCLQPVFSQQEAIDAARMRR